MKWLFLLLLSGGAMASASSYVYVNRNVSDLHLYPSATEEVVTQAIYGTPVIPRASDGCFWEVQTPDCYFGWIPEDDLLERQEAYPATEAVAMVVTNFAHLYSVPDVTPHPPVITLPFETQLEVVFEEKGGRWLKVRLLDGSEAWVHRRDVTLNPQPMTMQEMLELSRQFIGLPYRWGGISSFGFDCSGLVQTLYRRTGISLPRNSTMQLKSPCVRSISRDELQPGDLLFFCGVNLGPGVSHVGLYLGEAQFIHSVCTSINTSPTTQISSLNEEQWERRYRASGRVDSWLLPPEAA